MAWDTLKEAIADVIKTNGNQEITGAVLQNTLNSIVNAVGENAAFAGVATPATNPGVPDGPVFYFASEPGVYANFGDIVLESDPIILLWNNGSWTKKATGFSSLLSKVDSIAIYPYSGGFFSTVIYSSSAQIRFTGLNIKFSGKAFEKPISNVLQDIGQTTDYIVLGDRQGLFYSINTNTFKVVDKGSEKADDVCLILYGAGAHAFTYVHPSLAYFVYSKFDYKIKVNENGTIRTQGNKVYISPSGFGIYISQSLTYYVASVDTTRTEDYEFNLTTDNGHSYLVLDLYKLSNANVRTELSDVISVANHIKPGQIAIAYRYNSNILNTGAKLIGQFADIYKEDNSKLSFKSINNDILFSPEFYAYKHGRHNNANGVGVGWYERFRLIHISDTHQYNSLYKEALEVASNKANAVVNTGDDANGTSSAHTDVVKAQLNNALAIINNANSLPYIQVPGNHDVPGITKQDYFDRICSAVSKFSPSVVWGDAENYRAYGYIDFTGTSYEGNFRIIMLDPYDYNDGQFENTYAFMTAVFSQKQINWLINTLVDAANNGLNVITAMHYSFGDNSLNFNEDLAKPDAAFYQDAFMIPDIIDAIQHQSVLQKNYPDSKGLNNITINKDFSLTPKLKYVAHLFGHIHSKNYYRCQKTDGSKKYDMLMLGEAALGTYGNALNKAYRDPGTINEIAFSALEIDVIEQTIYRVAYGSYLNYDKSNNERTVKLNYRFND